MAYRSSDDGRMRRARLRPVFNFAAGAGVLPAEVLARLRDEMLEWNGTGMSPMELPFSGREFKAIAAAAKQDLRELLDIPGEYAVLLMPGGASVHFAAVPMNLLRLRRHADYVETGYWSGKAMAEARRYCEVRVAASSAPTGFDRIPPPPALAVSPEAAYCHITANETAEGLEYHWTPPTGGVPLVADMTSNLLSRPVDVTRYGLIYASAQKNIGPAGLSIVIVRRDLIGGALPETPAVLDYKVQADHDSLYSTPPTWAIYAAGLVFQWVKAQGGVAAMDRLNRRKSAKLHAAIDESAGFYRCRVARSDRSRMTVCFSLGDPALTGRFLEQARQRGLLNLAGHPAVGGIRASLYNAMPEAGVDALVAFMREFGRAHG
jgi:phosphoserine aminotransferase